MLSIIGGSGLTQLSNLDVTRRLAVRTPYGEPSGALTFGRIAGEDVVFLARHGYGHTIPPHEVNYRANIWALKEQKPEGVVSVASVGDTHRHEARRHRRSAPDHRLYLGQEEYVFRGWGTGRHSYRDRKSTRLNSSH